MTLTRFHPPVDHNRYCLGVLGSRGALVLTRFDHEALLTLGHPRYMYSLDWHVPAFLVPDEDAGYGRVERCEYLEGAPCCCDGTSWNLERYGLVEGLPDDAVYDVLETIYEMVLAETAS